MTTVTISQPGIAANGVNPVLTVELGIRGPAGIGADGASAYAIAVANGYVGNEAAWLASLVGADGSDGASAYAIAVANGYVGNEAAWLASLEGTDGTNGTDGPIGPGSSHAAWPMPVGGYYGMYITGGYTATNSIANGNQWFYPYIPARGYACDQVRLEITVLGASSTFYIAVYAVNADGKPYGAPLAATSVISAASTGVKTAPWTSGSEVVGGIFTFVAGTPYFISHTPLSAQTYRCVAVGSEITVDNEGSTGFYQYAPAAPGTVNPAVVAAGGNLVPKFGFRKA